MARILIVEDQKIMQKYFEFIILQDPDLKLVDTISDAHEAVKICNYSVIDLVLMDVQTFHNHDGLSAGKAIREEHPGTKVLIVTSLIDPRCWNGLRPDAQTVSGTKIMGKMKYVM